MLNNFEKKKNEKIINLLTSNNFKEDKYFPPNEFFIDEKQNEISINIYTKKAFSLKEELAPLCEKINTIAKEVPIYEKVTIEQIQKLLDLFSFDFFKIVKKNTKYEITFYFKRTRGIRSGIKINFIPALKITSKEVE